MGTFFAIKAKPAGGEDGKPSLRKVGRLGKGQQFLL
jgi:hypothetical protein